MKTITKPIRLPPELIARLKALKRPHQAIAGVIEELLDNIDNRDINKTLNKGEDKHE